MERRRRETDNHSNTLIIKIKHKTNRRGLLLNWKSNKTRWPDLVLSHFHLSSLLLLGLETGVTYRGRTSALASPALFCSHNFWPYPSHDIAHNPSQVGDTPGLCLRPLLRESGISANMQTSWKTGGRSEEKGGRSIRRDRWDRERGERKKKN